MKVFNTPVYFHIEGTQFQDYNKSRLLFFDIETTGLSSRSAYLYLIGAVTWKDDSWVCTQWFAEDHSEEADVIKAFLQFAGSFSQYLHFNGDRFDIPFLNEKCETYHLETSLPSIISRDLLRMIRPLKKLLGLEALNQRYLEEYFHHERKDTSPPEELIKVYESYVTEPDADKLHRLLRHNYEDLTGMLSLVPALSYRNILNGIYKVNNCEINGDDLVIHLWLPLSLPQKFLYWDDQIEIIGEGACFSLNVTGVRGPLKYFYPDYRNYYYLPDEDMAIHKSVAAFVAKEHREPAKASTCYTKKNGFYLPQNEKLFPQIFKTDYESGQMYFACRDSFLQDYDLLCEYVKHFLKEF